MWFKTSKTQSNIDNTINTTQTDPIIRDCSKTKTAKDVNETDFILPTAVGLTFRIIDVKKSLITPDGTTVTLTIEVTSNTSNDGSVAKTYVVEKDGFAFSKI